MPTSPSSQYHCHPTLFHVDLRGNLSDLTLPAATRVAEMTAAALPAKRKRAQVSYLDDGDAELDEMLGVVVVTVPADDDDSDVDMSFGSHKVHLDIDTAADENANPPTDCPRHQET